MPRGKYKLTYKERKQGRREREIDLLLALDLDLMHPTTDEEAAQIICDKLPWWDHPPYHGTLKSWRKKELYQQKYESLVRNEGLTERVQYWAGTLFKDSVVQGYESIVRGGPKTYKRLWLEAVRDVKKMAGLHSREASMSKGALAFLQGLGIGVGSELTQKIELRREDDGTIIKGEYRILEGPTDSD